MAIFEEKSKLPIFTKRFRTLRGEMSQAEFADFLGISRPTVGFYENGDRIPDAAVLSRICEKCNVSSDWLIGISDVKSTDTNKRAICDFTGLDEPSVDELRKQKSNVVYLNTLNFIISDKILMKWIMNYTWLFVLDFLQQSKYSGIPLKNEIPAYIKDIAYSALIRYMPILGDKIKDKYNNDAEVIDRVLFDYVAKHANFPECLRIADSEGLWGHFDEIPELDSILGYSEEYDEPPFVTQEEIDEANRLANEAQVEEQKLIIDFLHDVLEGRSTKPSVDGGDAHA